MIERYIYRNERGETVEFSSASVFHANSVTGVNDMNNEIFTINSMGQDGDTLVGGRIESRDINIVGSIKTQNKDTLFAYRRLLYHTLNPQYNAILTYVYGDTIRIIDCVPNSSPVFTKKSILQDFAVSLTCPNPFWRDIDESRSDIATWLGAFEFPLELQLEGIEMGYREPSLIVNVYNGGDVKTGMRVEFRAIGTVTNPSILDVNTREFIRLNMLMLAGDVVTVSTYYSKKSVTLIQNGIQSNAFQFLDVDSTYIQLAVGDNLIRYDADSGVDNLEVTVYHANQYLGV